MTASALATSVAAVGLAGAVRDLPARPLDPDAWRAFVAEVRRQRLAGHLADAVASGRLPTTEKQHAEAAEVHTSAMQSVLRLERLLVDTSAVLEGAGVPTVALKGSSLAHTAYPDPATRVFGDVDVLVPSECFDDAGAALQQAGCRRRWPQLRPGFDRRFGKGATFDTPDRFEIDLHRTVTPGPFGLTIDLPGLFETAVPLWLGGRELRMLAREERLLHACYHAALGSPVPRLVGLRDVAQLVLATDPDTDRLMELAQRWRGQAVVARAIRQAWQTFDLADVVPLSVWARTYRPSRRDEHALAPYLRTHHRFGARALASLRVIPGVRDKAAFVRAVVLPDRDAVGSYERGYGAWWRRGGQLLLSRGGAVR